MSELTRAFEEVVVTEGGRTQESAQLPVEAPLTIEVNGAPLATFMRLPGNDRELALGFLVTQGIVDDPSAVSSLEHSPDDPNLLRVHLTGEEPELPRADVGAFCRRSCPSRCRWKALRLRPRCS